MNDSASGLFYSLVRVPPFFFGSLFPSLSFLFLSLSQSRGPPDQALTAEEPAQCHMEQSTESMLVSLCS